MDYTDVAKEVARAIKERMSNRYSMSMPKNSDEAMLDIIETALNSAYQDGRYNALKENFASNEDN